MDTKNTINMVPNKLCDNTFFDQRNETTKPNNIQNYCIMQAIIFGKFFVAVVLSRQKPHKMINLLFYVDFVMKTITNNKFMDIL